MADYNQLKTDIAEVIRTNGNEEITGEVLQYILLQMVSSLGADMQFVGKATPDIEPIEPDQNIFYIGGQGQYRNFSGLQTDVAEGSLGLFMWKGSWSARVITVTRPIDATLTEGGVNPVEGGAIFAEFKNLRDAGYLFAGLAVPSTQPPQTLTEKIFYIASEGGIYANFGTGITLPDGLNIIRYDGSVWRGETIFEVTSTVEQSSQKLLTAGGAYTELEKKVDKEEGKGLSDENFTTAEKQHLNELPTAAQLLTLLAGKQDVLTFDNEPTEDSRNPVTSGGVHDAIKDFITRAVNDLLNYYTKSETYTKTEVQNLIAVIKQFKIEVVPVLPEASAETMYTLYLVPSAHAVSENVKDEYITLTRSEGGVLTYYWEQIGTTAVDLSNYPTFAEMNAAIATALASYYTSAQVDELLNALKGTLADVRISADKAVILTGVAAAVTVMVKIDASATAITLKRDGVSIGTGTGKTLTVIDNVTPAQAGSITYQVEALIGSVTRIEEATVAVEDAVYYGAGSYITDITTKASARMTPAGRYGITVANDGDHIYVLVPMSMSVEYMTMGGLDLPLDTVTCVVVDGKAYKCYRSANAYVAGSYTINVY